MAKGNFNSLIRGKLGNSVAYRIANSSNNIKQGWRPYVSQVHDLNSVAQAAQRMKLNPARNFYIALRDEILNHSWQGVEYGGRSNLKFMQLCMSKDFQGFYPFVPADYKYVVPGNYPLSRGSLPAVPVTGITFNDDSNTIFVNGFNLGFDSSIPFDKYIEDTLNMSPTLKFGDQITVVAFTIDKQTMKFTPHVRRLILDPARYPSASNTADVFIGEGIAFNGDEIYLGLRGSFPEDYQIGNVVAAGVIVSRPEHIRCTRKVKWLRSPSDLFILFDQFPVFFYQYTYEKVIDTYQGKPSLIDMQYYINDSVPSQKMYNKYPKATGVKVDGTSEFEELSALLTGYTGASSYYRVARAQSVLLPLDCYCITLIKDPETGLNTSAMLCQFNVAHDELNIIRSVIIEGTDIQPLSGITLYTPNELANIISEFGITFNGVNYNNVTIQL